MSKGTILDRLAGAIETLGKREGKALTPRQRVAAAQRWNSLADIGERRFIGADERANSFDPTTAARGAFERDNIERNLVDMGVMSTDGWTRAANPFLSGNGDKYQEQDEFLGWCRYKGVEPNGKALKQFRWETYKTLPYRERQWIANKDVIKPYLSSETGFDYDEELFDEIEALPEFKEYLQDRHLQEFPTYKSFEEFPDDFDYMWRY